MIKVHQRYMHVQMSTAVEVSHAGKGNVRRLSTLAEVYRRQPAGQSAGRSCILPVLDWTRISHVKIENALIR